MEKKRRNRAFKMSDSEIITILILFHLSGYRILKVFYTQMICKEWRQHFPVVLAYNSFVEHEQMVSIKLYLFLNNCCLGDCTGISIIDSTPIPVCHHKRSRRHKTFRGFATSGKGTMGGASVSNCTLLSMTAEKSSNGSWYQPILMIVPHWKTKSLRRRFSENSWPTRHTSRRAFSKNCLSTTFTWSLAYARTWRTRWCIYAIKFYWGKGRWSRR